MRSRSHRSRPDSAWSSSRISSASNTTHWIHYLRMDRENIDWKALERLRAAFLDGTAGTQDYWRSECDLDSYDQTFAQRIRWKWDHVLKELNGRGWAPPQREVVDWGCGS